MLSRVQVSYENMGSSSYLAIAFSPQAGLVNYQLEMLAANEIRHFLPVTKRIMNGENMAYYNISSKIALSQILGRRKLGKMELVQLLKGFLSAAEDGEQYQLPANGLVMETDYIFVDPSTMEPSFVYLPVSVPQEKGVKELVLSLVMEGKIELTGDNFVQLLLEAVNKQPFKLTDLKQVLDQIQGMPAGAKNPAQGFSGMQGNMPVNGMPNGAARTNVPNPGTMQTAGGFVQQAQAPAPAPAPQPVQPTPRPQPAAQPQRSMPAQGRIVPPPVGSKKTKSAKPSLLGNKKEKKEKTKPVKEAPVVTEDGFDPEKAKKKFLLPQAVVMIVLAALASFGAFVDESGSIAVTNTEKKAAYLDQAQDAFRQLEELDDDRAYSGLILVYRLKEDWEKIMDMEGEFDEEALDEETRLLYKNMLWIKAFIELCEKDNVEMIFENMQTEEFKKIQDMVLENQVPICIIRNDGTGIGFYPVNSEKYGSCIVYYGIYENGKRQGNGVWIGYKDGNNYYAKGQWSDDYPNGYQTVQEWYGELAEDVNKRIISGNVQQGLWNGAVDWSFEKGSVTEIFPVNFTNGKWVVIGTEDDDNGYRYIVCENGTPDRVGTMTVQAGELDEQERIEGFVQ